MLPSGTLLIVVSVAMLAALIMSVRRQHQSRRQSAHRAGQRLSYRYGLAAIDEAVARHGYELETGVLPASTLTAEPPTPPQQRRERDGLRCPVNLAGTVLVAAITAGFVVSVVIDPDVDEGDRFGHPAQDQRQAGPVPQWHVMHPPPGDQHHMAFVGNSPPTAQPVEARQPATSRGRRPQPPAAPAPQRTPRREDPPPAPPAPKPTLKLPPAPAPAPTHTVRPLVATCVVGLCVSV